MRLERSADGTLRRPDRRHEVHRRGQGRTPPPGRLLPADAGAIFDDGGIAHAPVQTGILFRPPADPTPKRRRRSSRCGRRPRRSSAWTTSLLEVVADPDAYLQSAHDLVLAHGLRRPAVSPGPVRGDPVLPVLQVRRLPLQRVLHEVERRAGRPVAAAVHDRHREGGPAAGRRHHRPGPRHAQGLRPADGRQAANELVPAPGREAQVKQIAATWPVGPRLDELVHRARSFRRSVRKDGTQALSLHPRQGQQHAAGVEARPEPEPRPHLPRRPARLPRRPGLPAGGAGRGLQGRLARSPGGRWSA